jgi:cytochrome c553
MRPLVMIVVAAVAVLVLSCGGGEQPPAGDLTTGPGLYVAKACGNCHGHAAEGSKAGPALNGLAEHWDEEALIAYLKDPRGIQATVPRLQVLSGQFPINMPPMPEPTDEQLGILARYLLEL